MSWFMTNHLYMLIPSHRSIMLQPNFGVQYDNGPCYATIGRTFLNSKITSHSLMFLNPNTVVYKFLWGLHRAFGNINGPSCIYSV
jgi:hypothetical protein